MTAYGELGDQEPGLGWISCGGSPGYPILKVDFNGGQDDPKPLDMMFDTGAGACFVSFELLTSSGIQIDTSVVRVMARDVGVARSALRTKARQALRIRYFEAILSVSLSDGDSTIVSSVPFRIVRNWNDSTLAFRCAAGACSDSVVTADERWLCGSRQGLLSTSLLSHAQIAVVLDGVNRRLQFHFPNDEDVIA